MTTTDGQRLSFFDRLRRRAAGLDVVWLAISAALVWFPLHMGRPISHDVLLRIGGEFAEGVVVEVQDEVREGPNDRAGVAHVIAYTFTARDGRQYGGATDATNEALGARVLVEYLPRYPKVNALRENRDPLPWDDLAGRSIALFVLLVLCLTLAVAILRSMLGSGRDTRAE